VRVVRRGANRGTQGAARFIRYGVRYKVLCSTSIVKRRARRENDFPVGRIAFQDATRDARARNASGARRERGAGRVGELIPRRRIRDEGLKGERDAKRCPPTLHGWAPSRQDGGLQEEVPAHVARLGTLRQG
jgi:hypothetical protein